MHLDTIRFVIVLALAPATTTIHPPSPQTLLARYAANQDRLISWRLTCESTFYSFSTPDPNAINVRHDASEIAFDGERISWKWLRWGGVEGAPGFQPKDKAGYLSLLWDGETFSNYRAKGKTEKGTLVFADDPDAYEANATRYRNSVAPLMGYYLNTIERVDTVLREAKHITLREEMEPVNDVLCHVIDARTEYGDYTVWIDPEHGYAVARAEVYTRHERKHLYRGRPARADAFFRLDVVRFEKIDDAWIPMELIWELSQDRPQGDPTGGTTHLSVTSIVLNPDHEALGSFVRNDVVDGTWGWIAPHGQIRCTWQDGRFLPQYDDEVIANIDKTVAMILGQPKRASLPASTPPPEPNETSIAQAKADAVSKQPRPTHPHCGLYCVYTVMRLADRQVEFVDLIKPEYLGHTDGSSILELRRAARDHSLHAEPVARLTPRSLRRCPYNAILHVRSNPQSPKYDHYELYLGTEKGKAKLYNPPQPPRLVPFADLAPLWSGHALFLSDRRLDLSLVAAADRQRWLLYTLIGVVIVLVAHAAKRLWLGILGELPRRWSLGLSAGQLAALGLAALLCGGFYHFARDEGLLANPTATQSLQKGHAVDFMPKLSEKKVDKLLGGDAIFVDARLSADYERGHLQGALSLPVDANEAVWEQAVAQIPTDARIVTYCQSARCKFAEKVGVRLAEDGYADISIFKGGWVEWIDKHGRPEPPASPDKEEKPENEDPNGPI